jgi:hypothetical protein
MNRGEIFQTLYGSSTYEQRKRCKGRPLFKQSMRKFFRMLAIHVVSNNFCGCLWMLGANNLTNAWAGLVLQTGGPAGILHIRNRYSLCFSTLESSWVICVTTYFWVLVLCVYFGCFKPHLRWLPPTLTTIWILSGTATCLAFQAL